MSAATAPVGSARAATRDRVRVAIVALGYRRNPAATALASRRSHRLGALVTGMLDQHDLAGVVIQALSDQVHHALATWRPRVPVPVAIALEDDHTGPDGHTGNTTAAVLAANDQMALGVIRALSERDIHVPDQVSVIGIDDIPEAGYFLPPLTTVHLDFHGYGYGYGYDHHAITPSPPCCTPSTPSPPTPPRLVARTSTAPPSRRPPPSRHQPPADRRRGDTGHAPPGIPCSPRPGDQIASGHRVRDAVHAGQRDASHGTGQTGDGRPDDGRLEHPASRRT